MIKLGFDFDFFFFLPFGMARVDCCKPDVAYRVIVDDNLLFSSSAMMVGYICGLLSVVLASALLYLTISP